ncbi:deoxyribose-phosphate aldolase-like [Homalodisca vitripennis]|uniref:deoxyribose-phosphate aldolase-like n=1 Tax=Homalodisca vitripennis TaxID=197043 RepID=UPI001EEC109B|nr:deoxyribose-phosphate aldolase-like [Homalodisca vitripennis]
MPVNKVLNLDLAWINSIQVNDAEIKSKVATAKFVDPKLVSENVTPAAIKNVVGVIDLSSLVGTETPDSIAELCKKATSPMSEADGAIKVAKDPSLHCAAVCVYPARIEDAIKSLKSLGADKSVLVAAVAAGFPSGAYPLQTRLAEVSYAVSAGAQEIDVVIDRSLVLRGLWQQLYEELVQIRKACGETTLKVILSVTECANFTNIYKASAVAMLAGADFIKTSTGKEAVTMSLNEGLVMCYAIKDFYNRTGIKVGLKPAGGVRTPETAINWLLMVKGELGPEWADPKLFRIGTTVLKVYANYLNNAK